MSLTTADSLIDHSRQGETHAASRPNAAQLAVETVTGEVWDTAVATFDGACQEQLYAFAAARWPSVKHEPLIFKLRGEVVGGTLMMVQPLPLRIGAIAVSKWGPMAKDTARADGAAIYAGMVDALVAEYAVKRRMMISMLPRASITEANPEFDHLMGRGFKAGSKLLFPNRYIVNLRLPDDEQRKSFEQKWRYHLKKSEKAGLSFEHAGPERAGEFDALYHTMTDRKKFPDHSAYDTVPALMALRNDTLRPELFFVRQGEEVIAGAIIFKAGDRAVYLYGATNEKALPLRAGYFMHWEIIRWLRDHTQAIWYDLGGTDGFQGLHQFKKGMVGDKGVIRPVPAVANYAASPVAMALGLGAFAARDAVHQVRRKLDAMRSDKAKPDQARAQDADE